VKILDILRVVVASFAYLIISLGFLIT